MPSAAPTNANIALLQKTRAFFLPNGLLSQAARTNQNEFAFETRPQQTEMAEAVAAALLQQEHLTIEAGTGVGKTLAYLIPLLLFARARKQPVAVSTQTITLQEQIMAKDIPLLQHCMDFDFKVVLCKGRANYICRRRLEQARNSEGDLFNKRQTRELQSIRRWADQTNDGSLADWQTEDLADLNQQSDAPGSRPNIWHMVCCEHDNCLARKCQYYQSCFLMQARARMFSADLLIYNHHLFFSNLALNQEGAGFLPDCAALVLDEAHDLEQTAGTHLGLRLTEGNCEYWLRLLAAPGNGKGILTAAPDTATIPLVLRARTALEYFFAEIRSLAKLEGKTTQCIVRRPPAISNQIGQLLTEIIRHLKNTIPTLENPDMEIEMQAMIRRGTQIRDTLDIFLKQALENHVYWIAREGQRRLALHAAPIEVGPILKQTLFATHPCAILTSATLAVHCGNPAQAATPLGYFRTRIGAHHARELVVGSPFNYSRCMRVYLSPNLPPPTLMQSFIASAAPVIRRLTQQNSGRSLILFTSAEMMGNMARKLTPLFEEDKIVPLVQGAGLPRHMMLERFRSEGRWVIFGLDSFWMGIDIRGAALSNVIITRLPFEAPDEPIIQARAELIGTRGGDAFREYALPEAILKFRQGIGRLIRSATDEGTIAILDSRITTKWYGRFFLQALPECPILTLDSDIPTE